MYAPLCDFVSIALLLPFVLGFCLLGFFLSILFVLVIIGGFVFSFGCSLLSSFFFLLFNYILIFLFFNNSFFLLSFLPFFLPSFLPFLLSHVAHRVLMLQAGVRPVPLRWESRVLSSGHWSTRDLPAP